MQTDSAVVIGQLAAPVVMISASGLISLALFNRLATLVARSRAFAHERVELVRAVADPAPGLTGASLDRMRLEALDAHSARVLSRASFLRAALLCVMASILAMLASSASIGFTLASHRFWFAGLIAFGVGLVCMAAGIIFVMIELSQALRDVKLEHRLLHQLEEMTG